MSTHKKLSPSKSNRWRKSLGGCPGSVREEAAYPNERSSGAAIDGTHTHTLLQKCVEMAFMPAAAFVGMELEDHDGSFVVDADRADRVQFALDYILSRGGQVISEESLSPAVMLGRDDLGGTIDIQIIGDDWIEITDYKDGVSPVTIPNPQLEQYGWCVLSKFSAAERERFKTIHMTILQPKLRSKGETGIVTHEVSMTSFLSGGQILIDDAKATDDPNAPLVPGDHCGYCKHKGACSALGGKVAEVVKFADLTQYRGDDQIRKVIEYKKQILDLIEGAEKEALRRFEIGQPIEGLKAVKGRGSRSWSVDDEKMVEVLKKCGVPDAACYEYKLISPAKMEKLKWTKRDGSEHTLSDKHRAMLQTEYITKTDGNLSIVPIADGRPAVECSPASLFGAVNADSQIPLSKE